MMKEMSMENAQEILNSVIIMKRQVLVLSLHNKAAAHHKDKW